LQELGGIDMRRHEAVGREELPVGSLRRHHRQTVEEHRVVDEGGATGDDFRDADQRPHGRGVRTGGADV